MKKRKTALIETIREHIHIVKKRGKKLVIKYLTFSGGQYSLAVHLFPKAYLKQLYRRTFGEVLELKNPKTYSEKLQWLKLYDHKPIYTIMADKLAARRFVAENWGEEYLVPLLGEWDTAEEIDFTKLPNEFIMKCNHNSGGILFCEDKARLDEETERSKFKKQLGVNYYYYAGEWPYKNIKRKVIAEKWMKNADGSSPIDYKLFCFNGKVRVFQINSSRVRKDSCCCDYFDIDWNRLNLKDPGIPTTDIKWERPPYFDLMIQLSEKVTDDIPFCRVDLMIFDEKIYFSEFTFFHEGGMVPFEVPYWDQKFGEWLELPKR